MTRNISIAEFLSALRTKDYPCEDENSIPSLYSNTLRYLYSADFQNGLYIDKSPTGSGSSTLIQLLTLYRIAKYLTFDSSEDTGFVAIYDSAPQLFFSTLESLLKCHRLFASTQDPQTDSEMDRKHIYWKDSGKFSSSSIRLTFWFDGRKFEVFLDKLDGLFTGRMEIAGASYKRSGSALSGLGRHCLGVIVNLSLVAMDKDEATKKIIADQVKGWYTNTLTEGKFKHGNLRLNPIAAVRQPFTIISKETLMTCGLQSVEFDNDCVIEINDLPFPSSFRESILKADFCESQQIQGEVSEPFVATQQIATSKDCSDAVYEECYGLYPGWDYNKKVELKTDFGYEAGHHATLKEVAQRDSFEELVQTDEAFATLIGNQSRYMMQFLSCKTEVEKNELFANLSDAFHFHFEKEADVLDYIRDVYLHVKKLGVPLAVAKHAKAYSETTESSKPDFLSGVYFTKKDLPTYMKFDNGAELVIMIPIVLGDPKNDRNKFVIYGDWRQNPYEDILKV